MISEACYLLFQRQEQEIPEFNPLEDAHRTGFANPVYDNFPGMGGSNAMAMHSEPDIAFGDLSLPPDDAPKPEVPPRRLPATFKPAVEDSGKDTQQLVETDDD